MTRRALRPAAALLTALATLGACGDDGGPASTVPPTGTYTLTVAHAALPGAPAGTTTYTGPMLFTATSAERVTGTWELAWTFRPTAGGQSNGFTPRTAIAPGTFEGGVYALDAATTAGTMLLVRFVPQGSVMACQATVRRAADGGGAAPTAPATCAIRYQG